MQKIEQYAKALSEIIAKPLFVATGIAAIVMGVADFSVAPETLKQLAIYFGGVCLLLGLTQPFWTYAKAVWPKGKGK